MKSFIQFLLEYDDPNTRGLIDRLPITGTGTLFPSSLGYTQTEPEGFTPTRSALIHLDDYIPLNGRIRTRGEADPDPEGYSRETVHFTRNGPVGDHMMGGWHDKSKVAIMVPEYRLSDRVLNYGDQDTYIHGSVDLPSGSRIIVHPDRLMPEDKEHIRGLMGADTWEAAHEKMKPYDPEKGIFGHEVDIGGRKITFSTLTPEEMASHFEDLSDHAPGKRRFKGFYDAVGRHLKGVQIEPIHIGANYATGWQRQPDAPRMSWADSEASEQRFRDIYGSGNLIGNYYRNNYDVPVPDWPEPKLENEKTIGERISDLQRSFMTRGGGDAANGGHHFVDKVIADQTRNRRGELLYGAKRGLETDVPSILGALEDIQSNPRRYHPTAYAHPESQAALKRQIDRLRAFTRTPTESGLKTSAKSFIPALLAGYGASLLFGEKPASAETVKPETVNTTPPNNNSQEKEEIETTPGFWPWSEPEVRIVKGRR